MENRKLLIRILLSLLLLGHIAQAQDKKEVKKEETEEWMKQDWPNLAKYREENAKLDLPAPGEKRVVFMGNHYGRLGNACSVFFRKGRLHQQRDQWTNHSSNAYPLQTRCD